MNNRAKPERGIFEPPPSQKVHVIVPLPSGQEASFIFFNRQDAKAVYDAVASHWKVTRLPPPRMVQFREEDAS